MKGKIVIERNMFYGAGKSTFLKAIELRKNLTPAEKLLWGQLSNNKVFNFMFKCQHPVNIFIVDFYCHKLRLVIEVDGEIHLSPDNQEYDKGRSFEIEKYGIKVIRFTNKEVLDDIHCVIEKIKKEIKILSPL